LPRSCQIPVRRGMRMFIRAGLIDSPFLPIGVVGDRTTLRRCGWFISMKSLILAVAMVLGWATEAQAAAPAPLTTLRAVHAVTNAQARETIPVAFEATVGYSRGYEKILVVQDGDVAIYVKPPDTTQLAPGDRVLIRGTIQASFRPMVVADQVTFLRHDAPPKPLPVDFDGLIRSQHDCLLVTVHAVVHAADLVMSPVAPVRSARLQVLADGGSFEANLDSDDAQALTDLLDAEVEITGVAGGKFDDKMQQTGVLLYVSSLANIKVLKHAVANPWSLPVTPMDQVLAVYHVRDLTPRVRIQGTVTYYQPGRALVLQNGSKSMWIATHTREPLQIGDHADATGFPEARDRMLTLTDGEIRDSHIHAPIAPQAATWQQLGFWSSNSPDGHLYDLVSVVGQVVTEVREASQDEYVLSSDGRLFTAIYRRPSASGTLQPMTQVPLGSKIRVTGICVIVDSSSINPGEEVPFNILLRSVDDISILAEPSWLNIENLKRLVRFLVLIIVAVVVWGATLHSKVHRQTAALSARKEAEGALERRMAHLEMRRSRVLEDINGSRPLAELLEEITEMVSFRLEGARCWCEVTDGARLGNYPQAPEALRLVREPIPARAGSPLGALYAGFEPGTQPVAAESEALTVGARLATLAIETRRVYSDLLHRSEFDLLTEINNRFSLEKQMDALIEVARHNAGIFGLIYIDLDEFKQVNDLYGHGIGDLYLQEVALRMKHQLRSHDMLARLGGDEFAVLVTKVRSRATVEEIAHRLERCLDAPFSVEGYVLRGAASVGIALYPEDGATRDSLLSASDAAMYEVKNSKQRAGRLPNEP
jgi:diguanylate cyclase (GGDEF)-like protein